MNNLTILVIKFVTCLLAFAVGLDLFFEATWVDIVSFSLLLTAISYFAGDMILLPLVGNRNALIADFLLTYLIVWIFGSVILGNYLQIAWGSIIAATIITAGEFIIHLLVLRSMGFSNENASRPSQKLVYSMEMADENKPPKK